MTGPQERLARLGSGRILLLASCGLAVTAAVALTIGAEDARLLRLGIVAALWAALLGAFAALRTRREADAGAERAEELRMIYRLELEREVAARREHELLVERELREQVEQQERRERADITALRGELQTLRETLQHLLGGDVLVERVALRAESTRLLPLPDSRTAADGTGRVPTAEVSRAPRSLTVSPWSVAEDSEEPRQRRHQPRFGTEQAVDTGLGAGSAPAQRTHDVPPVVPAASSQSVAAADAAAGRRHAEPSSADARSVAGRSARVEPDSLATPTRDADSPRRKWSPAVTGTTAAWQAVPPSAEQANRQGRRRAEPDLSTSGLAKGSADRRADASRPDSDPLAARQTPAKGRHGRTSEPSWESVGSAGRHTHPAQSSRGTGSPGTGSRGTGSPGTGSPGTGSHVVGAARNGSRGAGSHSTGRLGHLAEEQHGVAGVGSHSGGRSVDDLLAAYGENSPSRRRRRRADD